jgi:hemerythrin-like metal-binding protein
LDASQGANIGDASSDVPWPWLDFLEMDHGAIDRDHREAIAEGNKFLAVLEARSSWSELVAILHQSRARSARHFATEDAILAASLYPGAAAHRKEHERILAEIDLILAELDAVATPQEKDWQRATAPRVLLVDHCLKSDLLFKSHVMTHASSGPRED